MSSEARTTPTALADPGRPAPDAAHVAAAAVETWSRLDTTLSTIIGQRGVAALYKRSLFLTRGGHPCLMAAYDGASAPGDFGSLQLALNACSGAEAAAATDALFKTFTGLLGQLIGSSLTERLIGSIWHNPSSGPAVQDTPQ